MAFADPITLADNAAANQTFTRQSAQQNGSDWIETDATLGQARTITIRHSNAGTSVAKGAGAIRRHLVQFALTQYNSTLGKQEKAVLNLTLTVDPGSSIAASDLYHLMAFAKNFLSSANVDKLVRDET